VSPYLFGTSQWETTGFAQVSSVETTVYLSRAEKSRVETRVTSVAADNGNRNIAILLRNMFAVKRVRLRKISRENNESMDITSRGTRYKETPGNVAYQHKSKFLLAYISNTLWIKKFSQGIRAFGLILVTPELSQHTTDIPSSDS